MDQREYSRVGGWSHSLGGYWCIYRVKSNLGCPALHSLVRLYRGNTDIYAYSYTYTDADLDPHAQANAHSDGDPNSHAHGDLDPDADSYVYPVWYSSL